MLMITNMKHLAEKGLATLQSDDAETRRGLEEMRDMLEFFEQELPLMFEHWNTVRAQRTATREHTVLTEST